MIVGDSQRIALEQLANAVDFLDRCKADPVTAMETGAFKDAREWVEDASRTVVNEFGLKGRRA